mgnify:FL=1|jgi:uncharacterized protein YjeT (DUF2065 family)|tara:strand:+ start:6704 stop:6901 length:198 start_codon:yes stop_codon:yes gene_type:complete
MGYAFVEIISAIGLLLAVEGALYAAFPGYMRRVLASLSVQPDQALRVAGLLSLISGVVIVWMVRG